MAEPTKSKILLIEDDQFLRELLTKKLISAGFEADAGINGEDGLTKFETMKPVIVLLDIIMPTIDGFEVLRRIRAHSDTDLKRTTVVMLSNLGNDVDIQKSKELGANDFMIKANFTTEEIINKMKQLIK